MPIIMGNQARLLAAVCALLLVAFTAAGCGAKGAAADTKAPTAAAVPAKTTAKATPPKTPVAE